MLSFGMCAGPGVRDATENRREQCLVLMKLMNNRNYASVQRMPLWEAKRPRQVRQTQNFPAKSHRSVHLQDAKESAPWPWWGAQTSEEDSDWETALWTGTQVCETIKVFWQSTKRRQEINVRMGWSLEHCKREEK